MGQEIKAFPLPAEHQELISVMCQCVFFKAGYKQADGIQMVTAQRARSEGKHPVEPHWGITLSSDPLIKYEWVLCTSLPVLPVPAAPGSPMCCQPRTCRPWLCIVRRDRSDYLHKEDLFLCQLGAGRSLSFHFLPGAHPSSLQVQPQKPGPGLLLR